ncbi:histidine kinase dimerization/phosphoacceptor domain-containing protein, partial [Pseudomonas aeruginosa]
MHDSVAHHVSIIGIHAAGVRRALGVDLTLAKEALSTVESESREAVAEMRSLLGSLRDRDEAGVQLGLAD